MLHRRKERPVLEDYSDYRARSFFLTMPEDWSITPYAVLEDSLTISDAVLGDCFDYRACSFFLTMPGDWWITPYAMLWDVDHS